MEWTKEQLSEVTEFARLLMDPRDIAVILQVEEEVFLEALNDPLSELHAAYQSGSLETQAANNKRIVSLAKQGSSPAQTLVKKMELDLKLERIKDGYR
jgi:hypothetical protein